MRNIRDRGLSCSFAAITILFLACSADGDEAGGRPGNGFLDAGVISRPALAGSGAGSSSDLPSSWNPQPLAGGPAPQQPPPDEDRSCAAISQQAENQRTPADIIFAVDNSGSMDEEIAFVRERLNAFSQQIVASGIDVRIILISQPFSGQAPDAGPFGSIFDDDDDDENGICIAPPLGSGMCPADSKAPGYHHVPQEVGSTDALNLFIETFPQYQSQLRPNANKTFVVVTDDDAEDGPNNSAAAFMQNVAALPGGQFTNWTFSGIYCFSECPDAAEIGTVYNDLVMQKKGVAGDLCLQDFAPVFDELAKAVITASGLDCAWDIPAPPTGQTFNRDRVNIQYATQGAAPRALGRVMNEGACGMRSGWYYDNPSNPTRIHACPTTCGELQNELQAKIDVLFGCDTMLAPE
jgi:hypothetical protein